MQWFDSDFDYVREYVQQWNANLRRTKGWLIVMGVLMVAAGVLCALSPFSIYAVIQIAASIALIVYGISEISMYFSVSAFFRSPTMALLGVLNIILGIMLITIPPYLTAGTMTFLIAFLFIVSGFERISFSQRLRYFSIPNSSLGTVTGVIDIILGILFILMPLFSSLLLGYIIAAYLLITGIMWIIEALMLKKITLDDTREARRGSNAGSSVDASKTARSSHE